MNSYNETNFKQIIQDISGMAYYHPQLNSFGFGSIDQITMDVETAQEPEYMKCYVVPGQVQLAQNRLLYSFSVIILDRIEDDYSNQQDVMNDTLEVAKDMFTIMYQSYTSEQGNFSWYYEPIFGPNVTPFLEKFETVLGGWTLNVTLEQPFDYNSCVLPFSGLSLPTSVNYVNYKQILSDLQNIGNTHLQINSFGFGSMDQLTMDISTEQEPNYPKMYVSPRDTTLNRNELVINFDIVVVDKLNIDNSNQRDVLNDMLEICKDIYTVLYLSEYETNWDAICYPIIEEYETVLAGWRLELQITQPHDYNRCDLPELPFLENYRWSELAKLWKNVTTDWKNT